MSNEPMISLQVAIARAQDSFYGRSGRLLMVPSYGSRK